MCGVAGAIGRIESETIRAVRAANDCQKHRGPDDDGFFESGGAGDDGAIFAFRRLAIIDLSPDGHQPMRDEALPGAGNVIVFNGEIYNFQELRRELEDLGDVFRSRSDTEVILKAYARWGASAINRLRGMFALAIWDAREKRVLLARDRVGIKPLYLATIDRPGDAGGRQTLLFASELRSLLATGLVARRLNAAAVGSYIWNGFVVGPETIVEGVRLLPAGTMAMVDPASGKCELHRYWDLPREAPAHDGAERLQAELRTAMRQHLIADVPLGVFLSGGIDSSAVSALAMREAGGMVRTFNISFDEAAYDESKYAAAVAKAIGSNHTDVRLTQRHFNAQLDDALRSIDQPTFDAINTYFVSRAVREAGITVALAGTGGDELFGGYTSFRDIPKARRLSRLTRRVPEAALRGIAGAVARAKLGAFGEIPPQTRWGKLGDVLATRGRMVDLYQVSYALFTHEFARRLQTANVNGELRSGLPKLRAHELDRLISGDSASPLHEISTLELSNYIGERLLRDTDAASMAVSLEARVPLLDHAVIEAAANVPGSQRFQPLGRKQILRNQALDHLDPALFDRPKSGFVLPIEVWSRQELKHEVARTLMDAQRCEACGLNADAVAGLWRSFEAGAPGMYWSRVWAIFVLMWWCREHRVAP